MLIFDKVQSESDNSRQEQNNKTNMHTNINDGSTKVDTFAMKNVKKQYIVQLLFLWIIKYPFYIDILKYI